jgi:hypothetical protein
MSEKKQDYAAWQQDAPDRAAWRRRMEAYVSSNKDLQHEDLGACARAVAVARDGLNGAWACGVWEDINVRYYEGYLPDPLILWITTEWGACLGDTQHKTPPLIRLHPGLMLTPDVTSYRDHTPWKIPQEYRGYGMVAEVLLHEAMHVAIGCGLVPQDREGPWRSSHDNPVWVAECNRVARLLGLPLEAEQPRCVREPIPGEVTKTGKPRTKPVWTTAGNVSLDALSRFPYGVREELGLLDFYARHLCWLPLGAIMPYKVRAR